jgi:hypothetical protein
MRETALKGKLRNVARVSLNSEKHVLRLQPSNRSGERDLRSTKSIQLFAVEKNDLAAGLRSESLDERRR